MKCPICGEKIECPAYLSNRYLTFHLHIKHNIPLEELHKLYPIEHDPPYRNVCPPAAFEWLENMNMDNSSERVYGQCLTEGCKNQFKIGYFFHGLCPECGQRVKAIEEDKK